MGNRAVTQRSLALRGVCPCTGWKAVDWQGRCANRHTRTAKRALGSGGASALRRCTADVWRSSAHRFLSGQCRAPRRRGTQNDLGPGRAASLRAAWCRLKPRPGLSGAVGRKSALRRHRARTLRGGCTHKHTHAGRHKRQRDRGEGRENREERTDKMEEERGEERWSNDNMTTCLRSPDDITAYKL